MNVANLASANLALLVLTLGVGWVTLWPARERLGTLGYHLLAFPVGLLAWPGVAAVTTAVGSPYSLWAVLVGIAGFAALGFALMWWAARSEEAGSPVALWTYAAWGAAFCGLAVYVVGSETTRVTADSYLFYESWGVWLHDTGLLAAELVGTRAPLLPSLAAANRWLGGDWLYAIYPMIAVHVLLLVAYVTYRMGSDRISPAVRVVLAGGAAILMGMSGVFAVQWLLVHSHTASAAYLAMAILGVLVVARAPVSDAAGTHDAATLMSWSAMAGIATAGLILARPDGLAYAFVPASMFACACLRRAPDHKVLAAFFMPAVGLPSVVMAGTLARYGLWTEAGKLTGAQALGLLVLLALAPLVTVGIQRLWGDRLRGNDLAIAIALALFATAVGAVVLLDPEETVGTMASMRNNLLVEGRNGPMWYFLLAVPAVSILAGLWAEDRSVRWLTVAFLQFFAVAIAVHALSHPGRIGWGDSFNRVSFHAVPIGFMLLGTSVLAAIALLRRYQVSGKAASTAETREAALEA